MTLRTVINSVVGRIEQDLVLTNDRKKTMKSNAESGVSGLVSIKA
ncbi:hypothetical protein SD77_2515 [Bacillus badius]|uniref:Mobile element protein n=1 Tax=Bacillus badius TaxID=1455 RepID=A0ABR5AZA2_BACBA|nr:hypothetical protein SD78_2026 [Bacillus badius]KIL80061.1 hypothetical protein SD77_2515 [Bacillus badius]